LLAENDSNSIGAVIGNGFAAHLPSPPPDFVGRETDMFKIITTLTSKRLVTVIGDLGMGKSSVASAVAVYTAERRIFDDGVLYVRVQSCRSHSHLLSALLNSMATNTAPSKLRTRFEAAVKSKTQGQEQGQGQGQGDGTTPWVALPALEELVVSCFGSLKILVVLDHIDTLLCDSCVEEMDDFKIFLGHLFESCAFVKLLITSSETLASHGLSGFGVVENAISLGPISLLSSLILFTHLSPSLTSTEEKAQFVKALVPPRQQHVTVHSKDVTLVSSQILDLFGNGHPAHIVKLACECGVEEVRNLLAKGKDIISGRDPKSAGEAVEQEEVLRPLRSLTFSPIPDSLAHGISTSTSGSSAPITSIPNEGGGGEGSAFKRISNRREKATSSVSDL